MAAKQAKQRAAVENKAKKNLEQALDFFREHPLFRPLMIRCRVRSAEYGLNLADGWSVVFANGVIHTHPTRLAEPEEWIYVLAHNLLHLGFGHFQPMNSALSKPNNEMDPVWQAACDVFVTRFLADLKLGKPPSLFQHLPLLPTQGEAELYERFIKEGIPAELQNLSTAGPGVSDMTRRIDRAAFQYSPHDENEDWPKWLARGMAQAARSALRVSAGLQDSLEKWDERSFAERARSWFINHFPLLGALAASFKIIEDPILCARMDISVAAVDDEMREIYISPAADLDIHEMRFVMAHEMLHSGLRHQSRRQGRDPYLWNVACDYVINGWLVEMGLGALPQFGGLYDPELKGLSAESIYDRIVNDLRKYRKLATLRGIGLGDMLERRSGVRELNGESLDDFYRRCLAQGLVYHQSTGREDIPAGLIEEIQALSQPPIAWDVALAQWFDDHFPPLEKVRTYGRPSRRQSATPDIPRPSYTAPPGDAARTFGVILDTSGSMDRHLLAKALGAISSYSLAREVPFVRVVFCDAAPYYQGYLTPEDIAGRVQVKGRGGTVLQPGVDLLERAEDFPKDGPLLIITDGWCDRVHIRREHAYLMPEGNHLPYIPRGEVFYVK